MSTTGPLSETDVNAHLADARKAVEELLKIAHSDNAGHTVQYTQARHWQIDRMFQYLLANWDIGLHEAGNKRRELEARVKTLEDLLMVKAAIVPRQRVKALSRPMNGDLQ